MKRAFTMLLGGGAMAYVGHLIETQQIQAFGDISGILISLGGILAIFGVFKLYGALSGEPDWD